MDKLDKDGNVIVEPETESTPEPEPEPSPELEPTPEPAIDDDTFSKLAEERGFIPKDSVQKRIDTLVAEREEARRRAELIGQPAPKQEEPKKEEYTEADLERIRDFYSDNSSANYNPAYAKWAESKLTDMRVEKKVKATLEEERSKTQVQELQRKHQETYLRLCEEYPDLKDKSTPLCQLATSIFLSDPWYRMNPKGQIIATREAAEQLGVVSSRSQSVLSKEKKKLEKEQDKLSLLAGGKKSVPQSTITRLEKLEEKAKQTGDKADWRAYLKAVEEEKRKQKKE